MSKIEASSLAAQLGFEKPKSANKFLDVVDAAGFVIAIDNKTGAWVILAADRNTVLAKVA